MAKPLNSKTIMRKTNFAPCAWNDVLNTFILVALVGVVFSLGLSSIIAGILSYNLHTYVFWWGIVIAPALWARYIFRQYLYGWGQLDERNRDCLKLFWKLPKHQQKEFAGLEEMLIAKKIDYNQEKEIYGRLRTLVSQSERLAAGPGYDLKEFYRLADEHILAQRDGLQALDTR